MQYQKLFAAFHKCLFYSVPVGRCERCHPVSWVAKLKGDKNYKLQNCKLSNGEVFRSYKVIKLLLGSAMGIAIAKVAREVTGEINQHGPSKSMELLHFKRAMLDGTTTLNGVFNSQGKKWVLLMLTEFWVPGALGAK